MKQYVWTDLKDDARREVLARPAGLVDETLINSVKSILAEVKSRGDAAVLSFTQQFDGIGLNTLRSDPASWKEAWDNLDPQDQDAMKAAKSNIEAFHSAQIPEPIEVETMPGVVCRREARGLESAGLYVPGGTAPLVSTLMMLAIPAKVADVKRRVVVTPPGKDGRVNRAILASAYLCDVTDLFICGGAQAIAALAYGTETIPRCDKIFGPGNAYVAMAKSLVAQEAGGPAMDLPAGPSEAMVLVDENARPAFVASDLLSQAEHDTLAQVLCVCSSEKVAVSVKEAVYEQLETLPRKKIAEKSLSYARILIAPKREDVLEIVNQYAPEHLIVQMDRPEELVPDIQNAGSVFLGPWSPESIGDYASGTNHTLPTNGAARAYSGITLESFMKFISFQTVSPRGLKVIGPNVERLAALEELDAHRQAVTIRLKELSS